MKTHYEDGKLVLELKDTLNITLNAEADLEYRSHINGMQTLKPNHWVSVEGEGNDGETYKAWYFVDDLKIGLDEIDYEKPSDIEDWYGKIIYVSDTE